MIARRHVAGGTESLALYSPDGCYRFRLSRRWGTGAPILFVMLNPSTATELANDPTIQRCESRARAWGFPGYEIANLFAFRATDPRALKRAEEPVGAGNDAVLAELAAGAGMVLCAWGGDGGHLGRDRTVTAMLRARGHQLHALALTRAGAPRHPLYLPYRLTPQPWV